MTTLREELRKWFEENGEEMWTDHDMYIDEIFEMIEKRIDDKLDELMTQFQNEDVVPMAEMRRSGVIDGIKEIKEMLK